MKKLSSIHQNHLVLNLSCGHVGVISVQGLIEVYWGDVDVDAIERAARCSKCRGKSIASVQIIYIKVSFAAMHSSHTPKNNKDW